MCLRSFDSTHRDPGPRARVAVHLVCSETRAGSSPAGSTARAGGIGRRAGLRPRWAHTHESSTLSARTRAPLAQLGERWTLNPCRRGFESLEAHSAGSPVAAPGCSSAWESTRFGTGGSAVRVRSTRRAVSWHTAHIREWSSGRDARLWTERRWFDPIFPSTAEARSAPRPAAVAQSGERRLVTAEAAGSKPACGARPWW